MSGFWNPEPTYPPHALHTVSLKATAGQRDAWEGAAKRFNFGSKGAFLAWAADFAVLVLEAKCRADEDRRQEMGLWEHRRKS